MANHVFPSLRYRDARAAIDFLERAFGFELDSSHEDDEGRIVHAEMSWGASVIMLGEETAEGVERFGEHAGQGWQYVSVDDADAHHERAVEAGAEVASALMDTDYGSRDYSVKDPEGNLWSFGTYDPVED